MTDTTARPVDPATVAAEAAGSRVEPAAGPGMHYLPALDGLRAISVAAVVAFHLGHLRGGFLGVDVFFAISGFLITRLLLGEWERAGSVGLRRFWSRRFRRLVPALLVVMTATLLASRAWLPRWRLPGLRSDALAALGYVANWRFSWSGQSYFSRGVGPSPLRHTWSLAVEEQFYVLWPLLVLAVLVGARRRGGPSARRAVAVTAAVAGLASAAAMVVTARPGADLSFVYYATHTRVFTLCAGAWLATWWEPWLAGARTPAARRRRAGRASSAAAVAVVGLVVLVFTTGEDAVTSYRYAFQAAALLSALAVAGLVTGRGPVGAVLASRPLVWVGRRSYGIYLWSWPVQLLARERFDLGQRRLAAVVVVVSVAAAAASFALVEEPIRNGRSRRRRREAPALGAGRRRAGGWAVGALTVAAVAAVAALVAVGAPRAPSYLDVSDEEAVAGALAPVKATGPGAPQSAEPGPGSFSPDVPREVDPDASADPDAVHGRPLRVLVSGDSVGWSLGVFDRAARPAVPVAVDGRALIACGVLPPDARWLTEGRDPQPYASYCDRQLAAEDLGLDGRPDVVLLWLGAWEIFDQQYRGTTYRVGSPEAAAFVEGEIQRRVDRYRSRAVPTVIPLVTCFGPNAWWLGDERHDPGRIRWVNERLRSVAGRNPDWVRLIDPTERLCERNGTAREKTPDGHSLRADGAHFDEVSAPWFWSTWLAGQLAVALGPA